MTPQELLAATADRIEERGLHQGGGWGVASPHRPVGEGPLCTLGTMALAVSGDPECFAPGLVPDAQCPLFRDAAMLLAGQVVPETAESVGYIALIQWSDKTDKDDVVAALRKAAGG